MKGLFQMPADDCTHIYYTHFILEPTPVRRHSVQSSLYENLYEKILERILEKISHNIYRSRNSCHRGTVRSCNRTVCLCRKSPQHVRKLLCFSRLYPIGRTDRYIRHLQNWFRRDDKDCSFSRSLVSGWRLTYVLG